MLSTHRKPKSSSPRKPKKKKAKTVQQPHDPTTPPFSLYSASSKRATFQEGFTSVAALLQKAKRVVCLTGAGISVSCGIPDFRSKDSGLYATLDCAEYGLNQAEELFDFEFFQHNPVPFYKFAKNLYTPSRPSDSHKFLQQLDKKLLRVYSQNMDGLEERAGVPSKKVVYAHGSLQYAHCLRCKQKVCAEEIQEEVRAGTVAYCKRTLPLSPQPSPLKASSRESSDESSVSRRTSNRKRPHPMSDSESSSSSTMTTSTIQSRNQCNGLMKPGVTFFGQPLGDQISKYLEMDQGKVDLLMVIGTSLSVAPISKIVHYLPSHIPRILINRTIVHPPPTTTTTNDSQEFSNTLDSKEDVDFRDNYVFDAYLLGNSDDIIRALSKEMVRSKSCSKDNSAKEHKPKSRCRGKGDKKEGEQAVASGQLLSALEEDSDNEDDEDFNAQAWERVEVPQDRVFIFPGAQPPDRGTEAETVEYREVAHCDGCAQEIKGAIQKCVDCFDFDLCRDCFPRLSSSHFGGTHTFKAE